MEAKEVKTEFQGVELMKMIEKAQKREFFIEKIRTNDGKVIVKISCVGEKIM